ncbi:MAG: 4Fe-4S binding protein [Spirochaetales bacterium]|nr:4Fe-4S binding protein [Spirochaetales bacterium]
MKRKIITIDDTLCNGCGDCIPNCPEGAIQLIDNKARLISDLFCDGLGACLGHCPLGAISIEEREAEPYDERTVMENIIKGGENTIKAHLEHLKDHGETGFLETAQMVLKEKGIAVSKTPAHHQHMHAGGCPGARTMVLETENEQSDDTGSRPSRLTTWPIQLHLIPPSAPHFHGRDILIAADCVAFAAGDFHKDFLKDKVLAIACPKLDDGQEVYVEKIRTLIDEAEISSLTVMTMEVPCCTGLVQLVQQAASQTKNKACSIEWKVVSIKGAVIKSQKLN